MKKLLTLIALLPLLAFGQTPTLRQVTSAGTAITKLPSASTATVSSTDTIIVFQSPTWKKTTVSAIANTVTVTNDNTTSTAVYPTWVTSTSGSLPLNVSSTKLKFIPSSGYLGLNCTPTNDLEIKRDTNAGASIYVINRNLGALAQARVLVGGIVSTATDDTARYIQMVYNGPNHAIPLYRNSGLLSFGGTLDKGKIFNDCNGPLIISARRATGTPTIDFESPDLYITSGFGSAVPMNNAHVLIGTSTDNTNGSKFQVSGRSWFDSTVVIGAEASATQGEGLKINRTGLAGAGLYYLANNATDLGISIVNTYTPTSNSVPVFLNSMSGGSQTNISIENNSAGTFMLRTGATTVNGFGTSRFTVDGTGVCTAVTSLNSPILGGGVSSGGTMTLTSTSNATKGKILFGTASAYDEVNDRLGIGTTSPTYPIQITRAGAEATISLNSTGGNGQEWQLRSLNVNGRFIFTNQSTEVNAFIIESNSSVLFNSTISSTGLTFSNTAINTTDGDGATIDGSAGRFRKDATGSTFTLTNSFITANSIILLTTVTAGITTGFQLSVQAGDGSAVITFETSGVSAAPSANMDINFTIIN